MTERNSNPLFRIQEVFEVPGRGIVLVGLTEPQRNVIRLGDKLDVNSRSGRSFLLTVLGIEIPNWIDKPANPLYGVLVSCSEIDSECDLIGAHVCLKVRE